MSNESILYLGLLCALAALGLLALAYAQERHERRRMHRQRDHLAALLEESIRETRELEKQLKQREYEEQVEYYTSLEDALAGHDRWVERVRGKTNGQ